MTMNVQSDAEKLGLLVAASERPRNKNGKLFVCCACALLAAFSMGFGLGYSSPADPDLQSKGILSPDQVSWFAALFAVGAIGGGPIAGFLLGVAGRKLTLMTCALPFVAGWVLLATGTAVWLLYIGRILTGIGAGMTSLVTPVYIAEMSSPQLRGLLGASFQLMITLGILVVYALGIPFNHVWLAIVGAGVAAALVVTMSFMPDTPRFYLSQHKRERALVVLRWLRGPDADVDVECREIEDALDNSNESFSIREFCQKSLLKPLFISIMLMIFQQCSGINAVMFNAKDIMTSAVQGISPDAATIILAAVQVGATFVSVILMDVAGRKILLVLAGALMAISSGTFGLYYQLTGNENITTTVASAFDFLGNATVSPSPATGTDLTWLSLVSIIIYIIGFSIGWGPIPWLIMSEIFPTKARGAASAIAAATNWLFAFIVTKTFTQLEDGLTRQGTFWLYAGVCVVSVIFVLFLVPETKGKTLEEIEAGFTGQTVHSNVHPTSDPDRDGVND
ncbi:solute carrier family 2, facilitated glucose transporter member 8-like [Patiria miniata]|uniref:Major facilitator superfamily (MFS) profile domain-containing protein n=1 Tax=Patiria miniata TaxID=46514 RepID=A0A913ZJA6_PATMI|nr:solute carrier family 2, facilitated glucose transporter member 8-like [Patiria miniata]